jgi:hypothetical protein
LGPHIFELAIRNFSTLTRDPERPKRLGYQGQGRMGLNKERRNASQRELLMPPTNN